MKNFCFSKKTRKFAFMEEELIISRLAKYEAYATKKYFYGYCRRAYNVFDHRYNLHNKTGMDFYSLAHEYYLHLMKHDFKPLTDKPRDVRLSTWMMRGFHFVVLDALKHYNREFDAHTVSDSSVMLDYMRANDYDESFLSNIVDAITHHYSNDRKMHEIAHMVFYEGYKQKEVGAQYGMTPSAVNQRVKRMMDEVVTPFVIENYGNGIYYGDLSARCSFVPSPCAAAPCEAVCDDAAIDICNDNNMKDNDMEKKRITPDFITSLKPGEIFVFGSNLAGIHAGGAARMAYEKFGAEWGNGAGLQGQSYAIPTMQGGIETIKPYVDEFIKFAREHKELHFFVTPIGCGIAGFEPEDIAPLFAEAKELDNVSLPEAFL